MAVQAKFIADFSSFYDAVKRADLDLKKLGSGVDKVNSSLTRMVNEFSGQKIVQQAELMAKAIKDSGGVAALTAKELKNVEAVASEATSKLKALGKEVSPELAKLNAELKKLEKIDPWDKLEKGLKGFGSVARTVGAGLTAAVTAPIVAIGALSARSAIQFESSFAGVRKTVNATEAELATMSKGLRQLAQTIPVNVNELNRLAEAAGALGIPTKQVVEFSRVMALLGVTTNVTSDQAAESIAQIQNIFAAAGQDTDRFASTLVALGNAGASTESQILEMAKRIAGAGNAIGISQGEVLAFASALSSVGIEAEMGGSAISRVFIDMASAVSKGGAEVAGFAAVAGKGIGEFTKLFKDDAAAAVNLFISGLGRIKASGGDLLGTLEALGFQEIRVRDTLLRASQAGNLLTDSLKLQSGAWRDNAALTKEADERFKTFASQLELFKNRVNDVAITLGTALLPHLVKLLDLAAPLVQQLASWAEWFGKLPSPIQATALGLGVMAAATGPLLLLLGQMAISLQALIPLLKTYTTGMTLAGAATATLKGGLVVAGLVALAGALTQVADAVSNLYRTWKEGKSMWEFFTAKDDNTFLRRWLGLSSAMKDTAAATDIVLPAMAKTAEATTKAAAASVPLIKSAAQLKKEATAAAKELAAMEKHFRTLADSVDRGGASLTRIGHVIKGDFANPLKSAAAEAKFMEAHFRKLWDSVDFGGQALAKLGQSFGKINVEMRGGGLGSFLKNGLSSLFSNKDGKGAKSIGEGLKNMLGGIGTGIFESIGSLITGGISSLISGGIGLIGKGFSKLFGRGEKGKVDDMRQAFIDQIGGWEGLNKAAQKAGITLERVLNAKTVKEYEAAIDDLTEKMRFQDEAMATLRETAEKYGFTLEELGPKFAAAELDEKAQDLFKDFKVLTAAGVDMDVVLGKMAGSINQFVQDAVQMGVAVPSAMRPMIERMIELGLLTDKNGNVIESLEQAGVSFAMTMSEGFAALIEEVKRLTDAIARGLGLALDQVANQITNMPDVQIGGQVNLPDFSPDVPGFATGTGGRYLDFGKGTLAMLHGKEKITPIGEGEGGGDWSGLSAEIQGLRADLVRQQRLLPKQLRDAMILAA
jgi:TP901 family phage tail tape measure protein